MAHVSVPASTANLGAGFDCIGLAVDRRLDASATVASHQPGDVTIIRSGTLSPLDVRPNKDLIYTGFLAACDAAGRPFTGSVHFNVHSTIPVARGLGSSAAAVVAGAILANQTLDLGLTSARLVDVCAGIEGHADNVAAALHGGAVLSVVQAGTSYKVVHLTVHESLAFVFAVPPFETVTKAARDVLPPVIPHSRAVLAASRAASLVLGLANADADLLAAALDDVLHVPYRRSLVHGYDDVIASAISAGAYGATLSGSGSTLVAVTPSDAIVEVAEVMQQTWAGLGVTCDTFVSRTPAAGAGWTVTPPGESNTVTEASALTERPVAV